MPETPVSRLPEAPEYWEGLARRVRTDASGPLAAYAAAAHDDWYVVVARRAPWLAAASLAVIVALILTQAAADTRLAGAWMEGALAPRDAAGALVAGPRPPELRFLIAQFPPPEGGSGRRQP